VQYSRFCDRLASFDCEIKLSCNVSVFSSNFRGFQLGDLPAIRGAARMRQNRGSGAKPR